MRRIVILILSVVLVLGFSFSADARHQTEATEYQPGMITADGVQIMMSGQLRTRGEFRNNVQLDESDDGNNRAAFDARIRLKFDARVTPNTMGVLELENDQYVWGADDRSKGTYKESNDTKDSLEIRQAYIAHQGSGLLGRMAGFKIGHMLLALGNGLFYDHTLYGDDAAVFWTGLGDGELSFIYIKLEEGSAGDVNEDVNNNDDATAYVLALEYPMNGMNMSADVTYVDDQEPTEHIAGAANLQLWNFGLRGSMDVAGLAVRGDVEFQTGEAEAIHSGDDLDIQAWAFLVGADYALGDISLGAEVAYGTGDDDADDDDWEQFTTALGSFQKYTYVYDYRTDTAAGDDNTGIANTWYINVSASAKPAPDLTAKLDVYYLQASEDVSLRGGEEDDELGWEIDGKVEYQIDKNLTYYIEGGYLMPGDAYKNHDGDDADDAYAVRNGVILKF